MSELTPGERRDLRRALSGGVGTGRLALAAAGVTVVLWASAFVAIRGAGRDFSPGAAGARQAAVRRRGGAPVTGILLCLLYLGVFPTALAFTTWGYALARTTAGKMGATTYLAPAIAVLLSWAFLGQVPGWLALAGGALCLVGVAISRRRPPAAPPRAPAPALPADAGQR